MPKFVRVYTGPDGKSVIDEREFEMTEFEDTEGAHGLSSVIERPAGYPSASMSQAISWTSIPHRGGSTVSP